MAMRKKTHKKSNTGRPATFTKEAIVEALQSTHGLVYIAAKALGCQPKTIYNYADKYPCVQEAIDTGKGELLDMAEARLYKLVEEKNLGAICFFLKTQGKERGYVERQEHTGENGTPLAVNFVIGKGYVQSQQKQST